MKYIKLPLVALFSSTLFTATAQDNYAPPSIKEQTKIIIDVVSKYSEAIACFPAEDLTGANIVAMTPLRNLENDESKFAVLWNGDIGCLGGSGTTTSNIAIVKNSLGKPYFFVDATESEPVAEFGLTGRISKIVGGTKDTLVIDTLEHSDKDPNCCPTLKKRFTIQNTHSNKWRVISIKNMPPEVY